MNLGSFVLNTASSQTKDCVHLLKLLGVPFIQVWSEKHRIYIWILIQISLSVSVLHCLHFHFYPPLSICVLCSRLQGMLRQCAPNWWERGVWTQWHQRTWTHCRLEPVFLFASWTPRGTGKNCAVHVLLKGWSVPLSMIYYLNWKMEWVVSRQI